GGTRVKNTRDAVADLEDVGGPTEVLVRITDLGDPEAFAVLPQHLVRGTPSVEQNRRDVGLLPHPRTVLVGDIPVPEDAVPADGKLGGDRLTAVDSGITVRDKDR